MSFSWARVGAILQKELRDYRRNRFVIYTMAFLPLIFVIAPTIDLLTIKASFSSAKLDTRIGLSLLYMLVIPAIVPAALAAYAVVGEREQGTLEPVLITPIRREEFLISKALAVLAPTLAIAYLILGIFSASRRSSPSPVSPPQCSSAPTCSSSCCLRHCWPAGQSGSASPSPPARLTCAPPSSWARWPACPRSPSLNVITPTLGLALGLAAALLVVDVLGWRAVATMFDRERLVTGTRT